jgi:hypothetical protein
MYPSESFQHTVQNRYKKCGEANELDDETASLALVSY